MLCNYLEANKLGALGAVIRDRTETSLAGLSPSAAAVLSMLHFKPGLTTTELAEVVGVSQPNAVRLIDGLARQALIERGKPEGRVTPLTLTEAGHTVVQELHALRLAALDELLSKLPSDERQHFASMLDTILAGATTSRAFARTTCRLCEHDLCGPDVCPIGCRATEIEERKIRNDHFLQRPFAVDRERDEHATLWQRPVCVPDYWRTARVTA